MGAVFLACPYCSLSQGEDTIVYILLFMLAPYLIVSGTWMWIRRLIKAEKTR